MKEREKARASEKGRVGVRESDREKGEGGGKKQKQRTGGPKPVDQKTQARGAETVDRVDVAGWGSYSHIIRDGSRGNGREGSSSWGRTR